MTAAKPASLAEALAALQAVMPAVGKHATANAGTYKYAYAPGEDITPVLYPLMAPLGLSFTAAPTMLDNGGFVLHYRLLHTSGECRQGNYPLPDPGKYGPQDLGKAITYARRYALCALVGLFPGGDDTDAGGLEPPKTDARKITTQRQARAAEERARHDRAGHDPAKVTRTKGQKVSGTDDDPWAQDAPVTHERAAGLRETIPTSDPEDRPGTILPAQHRAIEMMLTKQNVPVDDREQRHQIIGNALGLDQLPGHPDTGAPSMLGLSYAQAADVIKMLAPEPSRA